MTVTQNTFVSRVNVPGSVDANGSTPAIPAVDRVWEPQSLFIHDWSIPCRVSSAWQTVVSRSRTGSVQRNGISDKPKVNAYYQSKCMNQDHWRNLKEMMSKQEVCKYASPLHTDACHGVTLFDPQYHTFATTSSLATRRIFAGQHAFIATQGESSMWDDFTLAKVSDLGNRLTNRISFSTPLRASHYSDPKIDTEYTLLQGRNSPSHTPIFPTYWGYGSGVNVTMWAKKSWTSGNPTTIGGYQPTVTGVETVRLSRAFAVLIKPDDQIVHIAYTMCRNNQSITLEPVRVRAVQGTTTNPVMSFEPTWTTVLDYTESGVIGGTSPNQGANFSHQRVGVTNPTTAQIRTTKVVIKRTTVTQAHCDGLTSADVSQLGNGQFAVVVDGQVVGSAATSTTSDNAIMQAVLVVRDGFVTPIGGSASLVAALDSYFMGHITQDTPPTGTGLPNKDYPSGIFPNLVQTVTATSTAPKSKMVSLQIMTYGNTSSPLPLFAAPLTTTNSVTALYPSAIAYPNSLADPVAFSVNQAQASASSNNDVSVQIKLISDTRTQEEPVADISREFRFTSQYASSTTVPTTPALTPFMFSIGLLLNPTIKKPMRVYPAIEADPSPPQMSSISAQTSTIGTSTANATQTSGKPALDSPDVIRALMLHTDGWDTAIYPKFQSNPKNAGGCNGNSVYPTTHIDAPLLLGTFDYASGMVVGIGSSVQSEQFGIGRSIEAYSEKPHKEFTVNAKFLKRTNAWKFLELWNNRRGRLMPVWFPSPDKSIRLIGSNANTLLLEDTDDFVISTTHGYKYLYVNTNANKHYILSISNYTKSNGVVVATVDTTLNINGTQTCGLVIDPVDDLKKFPIRITSAHLCFFDSDELNEEWITDEVMTTSFRLIEQPDFVPDDAIGITDPATGCGTCCGGIDECGGLNGALTGCPTEPGCCFCKTNLYILVTVNCYDSCFYVDEATSDPLPCLNGGACQPSGNPCTPTGSTEFQVFINNQLSTCSNLVFTKVVPVECASQNAEFALNLKTGEWGVAPGHLFDPCCPGSGCQCPPSGACCPSPGNNYTCGNPEVKESTCTTFEYWDKACQKLCQNPPDGPDSVKCGQGIHPLVVRYSQCCGGQNPNNLTSMGRLRLSGVLYNDWGVLSTTTGCSDCAGCA